ncbi:MAG: chemotaxis protein CheX [Myxococcaceae bacterium]
MTAALSPERLAAITSQILSEAAYVWAEPSATPPSWNDPLLKAKVTFSGPKKGTLEVVADRGLCMILAANFLGVDNDSPDAKELAHAALGELLNVLCGAVLADWVGTKDVYQLGIPQVEWLGAAPEATGGTRASLTAEDTARFDIALEVEG